MRLAVIPARGGSKRIPRKNIREFCGRPMIAWSITAALESRCFDTVIVSTDDEEIAQIAKSEGADVPFMRPLALSGDKAPTLPVINHALNWLLEQKKPPSEACCIYATAPFVRSEDLKRGLEMLLSSKSLFAMSVATFAYPFQRALRLQPTGRVEMIYPEHVMTRSQDLEEGYHDAGQFYWGSLAGWRSGKPLIGPDTSAVVLPRIRVQDIDTTEDWHNAELMFEYLRKSGDL